MTAIYSLSRTRYCFSLLNKPTFGHTMYGSKPGFCSGYFLSNTVTNLILPLHGLFVFTRKCPESRQAEYDSKMKPGYRALDVMEKALGKQRFLTGNELTIADLSLYAYTHVADQGGFDLNSYKSINRWLSSIQQFSGYVGMQD